MAIFIQDYTWQQTSRLVIIHVPIPGVSKQNLDVVHTSDYLKLFKQPFIFEAFFTHPVDYSSSSITVTENEVHIEMTKFQDVRWNDLRKALNKQQLVFARKSVAEAMEEIERLKLDSKLDELRRRERFTLDESINVQQENKQSVNDAKEAEKNQALNEHHLLHFTSASLTPEACRSGRLKSESCTKSPMSPESDEHSQQNATESPDAVKIATNTDENKHESTDSRTIFNESDAPIRTPGVIKVDMTKRPFPTAARASRAAEEREWLRKQSDAFRRSGSLKPEELREHENDPLWLKSRADTFYAQGSFLAAVNAYSQAAVVAPRMASIFSNRAACHLRLNNLHKALEDSSRALELIGPPVASNQKSRLLCHVRRGTALAELDALDEALIEYTAALRLDPDNQQLSEDISTIEERLAAGNEQ